MRQRSVKSWPHHHRTDQGPPFHGKNHPRLRSGSRRRDRHPACRRQSAIDLLGITTVSGNHNVDNTTRNALATCTAYGIKVPVAKGSPARSSSTRFWPPPFTARPASMVPELPPASFELDPRHGVDFIIDTVMAHEPKTVTLVPVGPYTNIGLAVRKEPRIVERAKGVICMGGAYTRGNITPAAEFNIYADPRPPTSCSAPTGPSP
jgi:purine nucleosidase